MFVLRILDFLSLRTVFYKFSLYYSWKILKKACFFKIEEAGLLINHGFLDIATQIPKYNLYISTAYSDLPPNSVKKKNINTQIDKEILHFHNYPCSTISGKKNLINIY